MATTRKEQRERARAERLAREAAERERQRRNRRLWQLGAALVLAAAIVIAAVAISSSGGGGGSASGRPSGASGAQQLLGGIPQSGLILGNPKAPVTVSEFADLQCPFCRQFTVTDALYPALVTKYVRTGQVKMVFRNLTFLGADSVTAAQVAAAAGTQNKLWNFVDVWYHNQGEENSGYVTLPFIRKIASGVPGLDVNKLLTQANSPLVQQQLAEAQSLAKQFKVDSTPSFIVQRSGKSPSGVLDMTRVAGAINQALR